MNPGLESRGLQAGDIITIKSNSSSEQSVSQTVATTSKVDEETSVQTYSTTSTADDYVTYTVQAGDSVFGILNKFGITLDDLLSLNPNLSQGLKSGMVLKLKN